MKNHWINKIRVKVAVALLSILLNDEFKCTIPQPTDWLDSLEDLIDNLYADDIVILNGLMGYEIVCAIDNLGLIERLNLVEKK